ncbi:DUF2955 domain-containing protein [Shewanella acanthi]|uniref:DUF2955 domain-containing protein n=1 Tax=Shewanella acanthi TaxID=2864212 RepID=UPI001C65D83B|nr:DUF2955 domain-containing protein [Shewanella acanthi]QYJ79144.1 DUF2955 domain-containing protein [Shewanella acanthi]
MHPADTTALRISVGTGLAVFVCFGFGLPMPHLGCIMAWVILCMPGEALSLKKGIVGGTLLALIMTAGVLLVPLLNYYPLAAVLLVALLLYFLMVMSVTGKGVLAMLLTMAITLIPIAGLIEQALALAIAQLIAVGMLIGTLVNAAAHALFPPPPVAAVNKPKPLPPEHPKRLALRATVIVLPIWFLALNDPAFYIPAVMKTVMLAQQSTLLNAKEAGRELVLSTLVGALLAFALWMGLSIWPSLLMLVLMLTLMTLWLTQRMLQLVPTRFPASFWSNSWITALILFGPAIADSANGKDVWLAASMRCSLYLAIAGYGWLCFKILEQHWPAGRPVSETPVGE